MTITFYISGQTYNFEGNDPAWTEVGNGYAGAFFALLGLEPEACGDMRAKDLLGRVEGALGETIPEFNAGGGIYQGGSEVTILRSGSEVCTRRLNELKTVCVEAGELGRVVWG